MPSVELFTGIKKSSKQTKKLYMVACDIGTVTTKTIKYVKH